MPALPTRRDALLAAAAAGLPLLVAWPGPAVAQDEEDDTLLLERLIRLEQIAVVAYGALGAGEPLDSFRKHDEQHAGALVAALEQLGDSAPEPPAPGSIEGLRGVRGRAGALAFAIELETRTLAAYYEAVQKLGDAQVLRTAATIMASEGQHLVLLRRAAGRSPAPAAFETGEVE